ncbi:MAG: hypothetical protein KF726_21725 [Anaerolineae bacterium]|nr:hypothetical protein [Anaerolineae bacterium]
MADEAKKLTYIAEFVSNYHDLARYIARYQNQILANIDNMPNLTDEEKAQLKESCKHILDHHRIILKYMRRI